MHQHESGHIVALDAAHHAVVATILNDVGVGSSGAFQFVGLAALWTVKILTNSAGLRLD